MDEYQYSRSRDSVIGGEEAERITIFRTLVIQKQNLTLASDLLWP